MSIKSVLLILLGSAWLHSAWSLTCPPFETLRNLVCKPGSTAEWKTGNYDPFNYFVINRCSNLDNTFQQVELNRPPEFVVGCWYKNGYAKQSEGPARQPAKSNSQWRQVKGPNAVCSGEGSVSNCNFD